ncbi:protein FAM83B [Sardina pilchardus]|uniref:protein FAM83B n=1 Tax=Sardina pilchardus TaxID=27697 RepID=UPI002E10204A
MLESHLSQLSSLKDDFKIDDYVPPHYRESYRLAIDALVSGGQDAYLDVVKAEKVGAFLSEAELLFIAHSTERTTEDHHSGEVDGTPDSQSSSGTYWPTHSDVPAPNLELGWPNYAHDRIQTNVELLFHPPRQSSPTIKEVIRKHIQEAQEVIAIAMDVFTDVDVFREIVDASVRGVSVYVLLDHSQFKSFLTMAESQDIQICKLTNMRVRTVKGQDYLCRTGAKFHGSMEQRFLLVDCRTVFFGSYSLMWSYEKINLSMVQVITGHLVASYDEEFRTLYARSTVPPELAPLDSLANGKSLGGKMETSGSQSFERKHLRHTLNTAYRQACERRGFGSHMAGIEEQPPNHEPFGHERMMHQQPRDYAPTMDAMSYLKRHSYAGERQEGTYTPSYMRHGASNWNVAANSRGYGGNHWRHHLPGGYNDPHHAPPMDQVHRGTNIRQSYHGGGKQFMNMQQNMPSLEQVSKSFMRDWRVESYLNNNDTIVENHEYLDQYDAPENRPSLHLHSRLRSSIVLKSVIPEQMENGYTDASSSSIRYRDQHGMAPSKYTQPTPSFNQNEPVDYRAMHSDFNLRRRSLQILDEPKHPGTGNTLERDYLRSCVTLGRVKGRLARQDLDAQQENEFKRHSVADPKSNTYVGHRETSGAMFNSLMRVHEERYASRDNARSRVSRLNDDQRSVSNGDFNGSARSPTSSESTWTESPTRTSSATLLALRDRKQERAKPSGISSPQFLKKSSMKIKSLLNIADKKEGSPKSKFRLIPKSAASSTDTIVSEDGQQAGDDDTAGSPRSTGGPGNWRSHGKLHDRDVLNAVGRSSAPRFSTEGIDQSSADENNAQRPPSQQSSAHSVKSSATSREPRRWDQYGENRRRFEPPNAPEKGSAGDSQRNDRSASNQANDRHRVLTAAKKDRTDRINYSDHSNHFSHDNKLGRLFQRVGNLIHKKT